MPKTLRRPHRRTSGHAPKSPRRPRVVVPSVPVPRTAATAAPLPVPPVGMVRERPLAECRPSPENDRLYRPVRPDDPSIVELADSIRARGVREPIVVSLDGWILSGHRRRCAAAVAGLKAVPCRVESVSREADPDEFLRLLREYNRQRVKSRDEALREALLDTDPEDAHRSLTEYRQSRGEVEAAPLVMTGTKSRSIISKSLRPFLDAVKKIIEANRKFWPLSDRQIHYRLLNDPPLKHAGKPDSTYDNTPASYKRLTDLLTRARLAKDIPMGAIGDETRPVTNWDVHRDVSGFIRREMDHFLKGYWRDLMQSQPNHFEIVGEKNTVLSILKPIAWNYTIPLTISRGYCSLPPRAAMVRRFKESGKGKLVLLILSDHDPDGEEIAHSLARSIRDDFGVTQVHPVKVALTGGQVKQYKLPAVMKAKESSSQFAKFTEAHGHDVFELEALAPAELQAELTKAIDSAIDLQAFNAEVDAEREDAGYLEAVRKTAVQSLAEVVGNGDEGGWDLPGI